MFFYYGRLLNRSELYDHFMNTKIEDAKLDCSNEAGYEKWL